MYFYSQCQKAAQDKDISLQLFDEKSVKDFNVSRIQPLLYYPLYNYRLHLADFYIFLYFYFRSARRKFKFKDS